MRSDDLATGVMLSGDRWAGPVTLNGFDRVGDRFRLTIDRGNGDTEGILVTQNELAGIDVHKASPGVPWRARAAADLLRHVNARNSGSTGFDMDPLPHQIQSIYQITNRPGDVRFLLADEPGAGKTAVASSIMREMRLQKRADKVLVVVPAQLKGQWRAEMKRFAGLSGYVVESGTVRDTNPWPSDEHDILITSIDYAKREKNRESLARMRFDMVVVDEAHHMNSSGKNVSERYRLGEVLSGMSKHMLFLTATPHRGKPENFRLLLKLLEPSTFVDPGLTAADVAARKNHLFLRHLKREMVDMDGNPIFPKRDIRSLKYDMSDPEKIMYKSVSRYVRVQHGRLEAQGERLAPFVLLLIQKRMASSTYALQKTLENRRRRLRESLEDSQQKTVGRPGAGDAPVGQLRFDLDDPFEPADYEDDPEHESWNDGISGISAARSPEELREEILELDGLIESARTTAETKPDRKYEKLREVVDGLGPDGKLLVFSEFVDTLDYLERNIPEPVCRIDGKMKQEQRDGAVEQFRDERRIMLATDAAREGINLQFCHVMLNYDLPWSPIALEQRMGRLHRYGQKKDVVIHNLIARNTIEGDVLERLFCKVDEIRKQYETVDVIGEVLTDVDIRRIMAESLSQNSVTGVDGKVQRASANLDSVRTMLEHTPVNREDALRSKNAVGEQRVDGEYLVRMMRTVFEGLGGRIRHTGGKTRMDVPGDLRGGPLNKRRVDVDGSPDRALARGTPYYDHVASWILDQCRSDLRDGSVFAGDEPGHLAFHTTRLKDRSGNIVDELVQAHLIGADGSVRTVRPDILHDLDMVGGDPGPKPNTDRVTAVASDEAQAKSDRTNDETDRFWRHRLRTTDIGKSLDVMKGQLGDLRFGTSERRELKDQIYELKRQRDRLREQAKNSHLHPNEPTLVGWARVVRRDVTIQDTERIGMEMSMEHERHEGWAPEDVSAKRGIGYDILSRHPDGRERHIEVKARCRTGPVQLTKNEAYTIRNDSCAILHVHVDVGADSCETQVFDRPAALKMTERRLWEIPKSELDGARSS